MIKIKKQLFKAFSEILQEGVNEQGENYQAIQLLDLLKEIYPTQLREEIISVRMYQTENACYLETTEVMDPDFSAEDDLRELGFEDWYRRTNYKSVRSSLGFIIGDEEGLFFVPSRSIQENSYRFLMEFDDLSKLNTTDIFSEKGVEDLMSNNISDPSEKQEEANVNYGELVYSSETLTQMDGYLSLQDKEALFTPFLEWAIDEGVCVIKIEENQEYTRNNPFSELIVFPDMVEFSFSTCCEIREWKISIPLVNIKQISIKSIAPAFEDFENLGDYYFTIVLTSGHQISIKGEFKTQIPEYWYYEHKVACVIQDS